MHTTHSTRTTALMTDVTGLHHAIATRVAAAFDAGGPTWEVIAPLVRDLLAGHWPGAPPVVLARALARTQRAEVAEVAGALARGDEAAAEALVTGLRRTRRRLDAVFGAQACPDGP